MLAISILFNAIMSKLNIAIECKVYASSLLIESLDKNIAYFNVFNSTF